MAAAHHGDGGLGGAEHLDAGRRRGMAADVAGEKLGQIPAAGGDDERGEAAETAERLLHANREQLGHSAADHIASEPLACALNR